MENVAHAVAIVKMLQKQYAHPAQSCKHAARTHFRYKSLTEFGAVYLKMIA
jgi:hypothetical protein